MAACRVSDEHDPREVQPVGGRVLCKPVERGSDVLVGAGIATAGLVGTAVADAPHGDAPTRQLRTQMAHLRAPGSPDTPAAAVNEDRDRVRAVTLGQEDVDALRGSLAVRNLQVGLRPRQVASSTGSAEAGPAARSIASTRAERRFMLAFRRPSSAGIDRSRRLSA